MDGAEYATTSHQEGKTTSNKSPNTTSTWGPLAQPLFRALWIASIASNIGTWMQSVGAAWLMTSLTSTPLLVALLQTAASLPIFLVGLPAGALADVLDRRRIVLLTQVWMLVVAGVLGALALLNMLNPWTLLGLTFLLSLGGALSAPAWQAIMPELAGREQLASAVALNGAGFNLSRAVGPALGGIVVAAAGPGAVFLMNAASYLAVVWVIYRWRREVDASQIPAERVVGAIQAGGRYARHAPELRAVLVRTAAAIAAASALWALLPVVARQELRLNALGYGILLGSIGLGAVGGAFILSRLRQRFSADWIVTASTLMFAATTLALAYVQNLWLLNAAMLLTGIGWLMLTSSLNVSAQTTAPRWVQARAVGIYLLVFQGCFAAGSAAWGAIAGRIGNSSALVAAAGVMIAGLLTSLRWRLHSGEAMDLRPSQHWPEPEFAVEPQPDDGPVLITVEYHVADGQGDTFIAAMDGLRTIRLRDGATHWDLFCDPANPGRFLETFTVPSWAEHMRQHERVTVADREVEERAYALQAPGSSPVIEHLISARASARSAGGGAPQH